MVSEEGTCSYWWAIVRGNVVRILWKSIFPGEVVIDDEALVRSRDDRPRLPTSLVQDEDVGWMRRRGY